MSAERTPGPWEAVEYTKGGDSAFVRIDEITIEGAYLGGDNHILHMADARLISAAPDLLDALCALVLNIDAGKATLIAMCDARAAIAKATGEES